MIPARFKRITAALDDDARARLCQSSGSEHSANNSLTDLSDLVDSFFDGSEEGDESYGENDDLEDQRTESFYGSDTDDHTKEMLIDLIAGGADEEYDHTKRAIHSEVETICRNFENSSSEGFKRRLMTVLRHGGYDAGLCKSRWEKTARHPAGEYEYIDVLISGNRYIVEASLLTEFTIARPTKTYQSLLETIPKITVIKPNELKKLVRLMCAEMRASLKTRDMLVSPWRKNGYMQTKWFGSYKRTTNHLPSKLKTSYGGGEFDGESLLGFEFLPRVIGGESYFRKELGRMHVVGNLKSLMLSGMSS